MKLKELEVINWGPHEHIKLGLGNGLIGITGSNGKGKSNLLQAINYAVTGDLNKQKQEKYIRNYGAPGGAESAEVRLLFETNGKEGEIVRTIKGSSSRRKLLYDGEVFAKSADVDARLESILGVDMDSLGQAVFLKQGELAKLVKGTPSERKALFMKLINLSFLEQRVEQVNSMLSSLKKSSEDNRPMLEFIKDKIKNIEATIAEYAGAREEVESLRKEITCLDHVIARASELSALQNSISQAATEQLRLEDSIVQGLSEILEQPHDIEELRILVADAEKQVDICYKEVQKVLGDVLRSQDKNRIQEQLQGIKKELEQIPENIEEEIQVCEQQEKQNAQKLEDIRRKKALLQELDEKVNNEIIRTNTELSNLSKEKQALEVKRANWEQRFCERGSKRTQLKEFQHKLELLKLETHTCPVCGSYIDVESLMDIPGFAFATPEEAIEIYTQEINEITEYLAKADDELDIICSEFRSCSCKEEMQQIKLSELTQEANRLQNELQGYEHINEGDEESLKVRARHLSEDLARLTYAKKHKASLEERKRQLEVALSNYGDVVSVSQEVLDSLQTSYQESQERSSSLKNSLQSLELVNASLEKIMQELDANNKKAVKCTKDVELAAMLYNTVARNKTLRQATLAEYEAMKVSCTEKLEEARCHMNKLLALEDEKKRLMPQLYSYEKKVERDNKKIQLISDLELIKQLLSKNGLPEAYMQDVFLRMTKQVQDMLGKMDANFLITPDPERPCSYLFSRVDDDSGFMMQQEQLSGGQAIRLALAMLLACQRIILPEVGLLILDEPSSHMDKTGVEALCELFSSMDGLLHNSDMTIIVVDHNEALTSTFPKVIWL